MIKFNKPMIGKKDLESVLYCMIKDDFSPGDYLKTFSSMLSKELNLNNVAVFNTYFNSFESLFHLMGASPDDEIIIPSFARYGILYSIRKCRLKPVLIDLAEDSLLPSFDGIRKILSKNARCIIIPQMFGIPHDISRYHDFCLPVIEDIDGSIGSAVNGKPIGRFGSFVTMNFNDNAILTTGSGGLAASMDKRLGSLIRTLKDEISITDCLMNDFNASLGISQLTQLKKILDIRRKIGECYDEAVMASGCTLVGRDEGKELSYSSYVVKTETPLIDCMRSFKRYGIPVKRGVEKPLHSYLNLETRKYINTEEMYRKLIALPIYPTLTQEDIGNIVKGIRTIL